MPKRHYRVAACGSPPIPWLPKYRTENTPEQALRSPLQQTAVPLEVTASFDKKELQLAIKIGVSEADLEKTGEPITAEFDLLVRVTDPTGALISSSDETVGVKVRAEERNRALQQGLHTKLRVVAPTKGFYRINVAVQSKQTGDVGSTTQLIQAKF